MPGEQAFPFQTERRTVLDGGLDTRAGVFVDGTKTTQLQNFRFSETGSLTKRKGGSRLALVPPLAAASDLPAPVVTGSGAGGTLAAGTYTVKYVLGTIHGGKVGVSTAGTPYVAGGATSALAIRIPAHQNGGGAGAVSAIVVNTLFGVIDDPINSGYINSSNTKVYVDKDGGGYKLQSSPSFTFTTEVTTGRYRLNLTSYDAAGAAAPNLTDVLPFRSLHWHPGLDMTIAWIADRALYFTGAHTSPAYLSQALESSGTPFYFSRLPTRICAAILDNVMIATDGVGPPKRLNCTFSSGIATPDSFRLCGARTPAAAPTAANAGVGNVTGIVQYVVTFNYQTTRPDGTSTITESNASAALSHNVGGNQIVTVTQPAPGSESGLVSWNVYRSVAAGSSVFQISTASREIGIATTTFSDNILDANLLAITPPDGAGKLPNDPPPSYTDLMNGALHYVTEHVGRLWASQVQWAFNSSFRITRLRGTNVIYYTKAGSFDAWPTEFSVKCGSYSAITDLKSFRGVLYVFKQDEVGVIEGSSDLDFSYRTIWHGAGAMENSVVEVTDCLYAFDQAFGPIRISGYTVEPMGEDAVQTQWANAITLSASGEASTGGGRGAALILNVIWDPLECEVRWVVSDFVTDYTVVSDSAYVIKTYEYVMQVRDRDPRFSVFTGAVSSTTKDRRIMGSCKSVIGANAIYQARDVLYGDYHGRLVRDNQVEYDLDPATIDISVSASWPMFFGDNPEAVKLWRYLYVLITTGATATDALTFSTRSLAKQTGGGVPKTLQLVNGGSVENRMIRMDLKDTLDSVNTADRGLLLTLAGVAQSGPLRIRELAAKMTSGHDGRNAP